MTIANLSAAGGGEGAEHLHLASAFLHLEYDLESGRASLATASSRPLVLSATAAVALEQGDALASDPRYTRSSLSMTLSEPPLAGQQLRILCHDTHRCMDLEYRLTLLQDRAGVVLELILSNVSPEPVGVQHAE